MLVACDARTGIQHTHATSAWDAFDELNGTLRWLGTSCVKRLNDFRQNLNGSSLERWINISRKFRRQEFGGSI